MLRMTMSATYVCNFYTATFGLASPYTARVVARIAFSEWLDPLGKVPPPLTCLGANRAMRTPHSKLDSPGVC